MAFNLGRMQYREMFGGRTKGKLVAGRQRMASSAATFLSGGTSIGLPDRGVHRTDLAADQTQIVSQDEYQGADVCATAITGAPQRFRGSGAVRARSRHILEDRIELGQARASLDKVGSPCQRSASVSGARLIARNKVHRHRVSPSKVQRTLECGRMCRSLSRNRFHSYRRPVELLFDVGQHSNNICRGLMAGEFCYVAAGDGSRTERLYLSFSLEIALDGP